MICDKNVTFKPGQMNPTCIHTPGAICRGKAGNFLVAANRTLDNGHSLLKASCNDGWKIEMSEAAQAYSYNINEPGIIAR